MITNALEQSIKDALKELNLETESVHFEHPEHSEHGDYATNVALALAKKAGKNPRELADAIAETLSANLPAGVSKVEVAGPGFINFYLTNEFFGESIEAVLDAGENYGKNETLKGEKWMYEYTDANPFKVFHIGHLMSNAVGESLSRIAVFQGAEVLRGNYQGDIGLHVAKAVWAIREDKGNIPDESVSLEERVIYLGKRYVFGEESYEANKEDINAVNKALYEKSDEELNALYAQGRQWSLDYFETIYTKLGTKFDHYFFESEVGPKGVETVKQFIGSVFEESDGAVIYKGEKHGLHTRVFINSLGLPTYEAKEIGLNLTKFEVAPDLDHSVIVTANEIDEYFKVLLNALKEIDQNVGEKTEHISHGMLKLTSGKMSSRKGNIITGESLIADTEELVAKRLAERNLSEDTKQAIKTTVAVAALKFMILRTATGGDIVYDAEKSVSFEGDSGPYLQYAYTRAQSVLRKASLEGIEPNVQTPKEIGPVERLLYQFPELVKDAHVNRAPHTIVTYLTELAGAFNSFYAQGKIIDSDNKEVSAYKLALTKAFAITMKNGLWLLGIEAPEEM